ncbi:MAG: rubrerythrin family protein [Desulfatiglans sp.]|jgi:rubrerythrin|nr:rubrerythrin family protein [Thermodesulfobacteriota bacterium]MEE4354016.1 rubrerythrin family protein [Desulfatiglans sp.]
MNEETEKNLTYAFAVESKAAVRTQTYALKADQEGYTELARLLRAIANAKTVHAQRFLRLMRGKVGTTKKNLETALKSEVELIKHDYPSMIQQVARERSKALQESFEHAMHTDAEYVDFYRDVLKNLQKKGPEVYYVCQICGHMEKTGIPERCPVCHAVSTRFKKVI